MAVVVVRVVVAEACNVSCKENGWRLEKQGNPLQNQTSQKINHKIIFPNWPRTLIRLQKLPDDNEAERNFASL